MTCACWICWGDAWRKGIYGDWDEVVCLGCGRYKISRSFLKESLGKSFDVQKMREELERWRTVGHVPVVSSHNARFTWKYPQDDDKLVGWPSVS
jgi:hypothetical protein